MYKLNFNNIDFSGLFKVLEVKKSILPPRTNYTVNIPNMHGEYYMGFKYGLREIEISIAIICKTEEEYNNIIRILADAMNVNEPKRLYLGEELDKYYYAIPDAGDTIDQVLSTGLGTIKFICYDPIAYTDVTNLFESDNFTGITTIKNGGTVETNPIISVGFTQPAHFLQATNYNGDTILVGNRPSVDKPSIDQSPIVMDDPCETTTNWISSGNILDQDVPKEVMGTAVVNKYGTGITGGDYGSSDKGWHGSCIRRNIGHNLESFYVTVDCTFDSKDTGVSGSGNTGDNEKPSNSGDFKIKADPCLRIRQGRSTNTKQVGAIPNGTKVHVTEIEKGWGKVTYNNVTGFISMTYTVAYSQQQTNYKVTAVPGLNLRKGRGTNYGIVTSMPNNTKIRITDISKGWGYVENYNGKKGYCSMDYVSPISRNAEERAIKENEFADFSKMGRIEIYLFDENSQKIAKLVVKDTQEFYEFTQPEIYFGNKLILNDNTSCPPPKKLTSTDKDGNTSTVNIDSGKYGAWNDGQIRFTITREKVGKNYHWGCSIYKLKSGQVVKTINSNTIINNDLPIGKLSSIVVYFGQYKSAPIMDSMSLDTVLVSSINPLPSESVNIPIFKSGDELVINCEEQRITLNGESFMNELDIGSTFFSSEAGESQFIVVSDDRYANVVTGIRERFI